MAEQVQEMKFENNRVTEELERVKRQLAKVCRFQMIYSKRHLHDIEHCSGSNVIPMRARPGLAGLRPHNVKRQLSKISAKPFLGRLVCCTRKHPNNAKS